MTARVLVVFAVAAAVTGCAGGAAQQGGGDLRGITSVLVARHGKIVRERYYDGMHPGDKLPILSITKSFTSALVGLAIADGYLSGTGARLPWRRKVTVGRLLSMTAGYAPSVNFKRTDPETLAERPLLNTPAPLRTTAAQWICSPTYSRARPACRLRGTRAAASSPRWGSRMCAGPVRVAHPGCCFGRATCSR